MPASVLRSRIPPTRRQSARDGQMDGRHFLGIAAGAMVIGALPAFLRARLACRS